jgi:hypothetical protein
MYNVETIQQNLKAIATAHADFAKTSFEQGKTYVEQIAQVKSLDKAVELHTQYAKMAYETFRGGSQQDQRFVQRVHQGSIRAFGRGLRNEVGFSPARKPRRPQFASRGGAVTMLGAGVGNGGFFERALLLLI